MYLMDIRVLLQICLSKENLCLIAAINSVKAFYDPERVYNGYRLQKKTNINPFYMFYRASGLALKEVPSWSVNVLSTLWYLGISSCSTSSDVSRKRKTESTVD
jgi:hypothetical protein